MTAPNLRPFDEFCEWLESGDPITTGSCLRHLLAVSLAATLLPHVEPTDVAEPARVGDAEVHAVTGRLRQSLRAHDFYWEVYDPFEESTPVVGSLTDDVAGVYRDIRSALLELAAGRETNAVWDLRFGFDVHWGRHATDAIRGSSA